MTTAPARLGITMQDDLPPRECPACGEVMRTGIAFSTYVVYAHLKDCSVLARREKERSRQQAVSYAMQLREQRANLPADPDTGAQCDNLEAYIQRWGASPETQDGIHACRLFRHQCKSLIPMEAFTLVGELGGGKSSLLAAFGRSLLQDGVNVRYESCPQLYNHLFSLYRRGALEEACETLSTVSVLLLDDLGREKPTPFWVDQMLFPILDERYAHRRPTVCATNLSWELLSVRWGGAGNDRGDRAFSHDAIIDRLQHRCLAVPFGGRVSNRIRGAR